MKHDHSGHDHSAHDHARDHHGHDHGHSHAPADFGVAFAIATLLNFALVAAQVVYGLSAYSIALLADAGWRTPATISATRSGCCWPGARTSWRAGRRPNATLTAFGQPRSSRH
jgi:cobalt-zinc-cadmium efflux system protein